MARLQLQRPLAARPERVWRALTEASSLAAWFWPDRLAPVVGADPRPGGTFSIESAATGLSVSGEYLVVEAPTRLSFTWRWAGEELSTTVVTIELADPGTGTLLTVVHEGFPDEGSRDDHITGWADCLDRLPAFLTADDLTAAAPES